MKTVVRSSTFIISTPSHFLSLSRGHARLIPRCVVRNMNFVGLLIPGYPIRTDFQAIDQGKCVLTLSCPGDLTAPLASVTEIGLFLLPNASIPAGFGVLCYWQITAVVAQPGQAPAATGYELLGPMTPHNQPSAIFQTGWAEHEQLVEISSTSVPVKVTFAVSIEPLTNIENLAQPQPEKRLFVAQKVALDLVSYISNDTSNRARTFVRQHSTHLIPHS